jgi:hypothetical protein
MNEEMQQQIIELAQHQIPFYAYGGNEAACDMANRLNEIAEIVSRVQPEVKPTNGGQEYYDWNGAGRFYIPRCQFLLHRTKKIEEKLIKWCKEKKYSQGDSYSVRITNKGKWAVGYSSDYPMQYGDGREYFLTEEEFLEVMKG